MASSTKPSDPGNEPIRQYPPGSDDRRQLESAIAKLSASTFDVPIVIGDDEYRPSDQVRYQLVPFDHSRRQPLAKFYYATPQLIQLAIEKALTARTKWERTPLHERASVFFRAADLLASQHRMEVNAATILGQAKTAYQAEIDAACELIDFFRYNAYFALQIEADYSPLR